LALLLNVLAIFNIYKTIKNKPKNHEWNWNRTKKTYLKLYCTVVLEVFY
jgi:hypothetical protein